VNRWGSEGRDLLQVADRDLTVTWLYKGTDLACQSAGTILAANYTIICADWKSGVEPDGVPEEPFHLR
jgi:hypothetical protein